MAEITRRDFFKVMVGAAAAAAVPRLPTELSPTGEQSVNLQEAIRVGRYCLASVTHVPDPEDPGAAQADYYGIGGKQMFQLRIPDLGVHTATEIRYERLGRTAQEEISGGAPVLPEGQDVRQALKELRETVFVDKIFELNLDDTELDSEGNPIPRLPIKRIFPTPERTGQGQAYYFEMSEAECVIVESTASPSGLARRVSLLKIPSGRKLAKLKDNPNIKGMLNWVCAGITNDSKVIGLDWNQFGHGKLWVEGRGANGKSGEWYEKNPKDWLWNSGLSPTQQLNLLYQMRQVQFGG